MEHRPQKDVWLTAAECARRTGLSVRALRLYERYGLITPRRTLKDWRLYGTQEIGRLNEVLMLKGFGLSLSRIAELLRGRPVDLRKLLDLQHDTLLGMRERAENGLRVIEAARASLAAAGTIALDDLTQLAREAAMTEKTSDDRAWLRYEQARPRTEAAIDPALYADYVGFYQLEDGHFLKVVHEGSRFFGGMLGQPNIDLTPEGPDRFFNKLSPMQFSFDRDESGAVSGLVIHQNGFELHGRRIEAAAYRKAEEALQKRIRDQAPIEGSEAIMRRIVDTHVQGTPDLDRMTPSMAAMARDFSDTIRTNVLGEAGPLRSLTFKGVNAVGLDVYSVRFERVAMEWAFGLNHAGKIASITIRPSV
ncbi:MAG: MerR family transcriptional regulator [Bauldia sp.]